MNDFHNSRRSGSVAAAPPVATAPVSHPRLHSLFHPTDDNRTEYPQIVPAAAFLIDGPAIRNRRKLLKTKNGNRF
jgi:hypothetical protein